ncbi:MAG: hypothetical protein DRP27_09600 [Thermotogae bacterium]|nr:MAG: hypothetical protein DRP27_09600 [Thermotogota bacterium]
MYADIYRLRESKIRDRDFHIAESGAQHAFCNVKKGRGSASHMLTQLALAFFLVCIHKTTHARIQRPASASLSSASMRPRGRFVWMLPRRS